MCGYYSAKERPLVGGVDKKQFFFIINFFFRGLHQALVRAGGPIYIYIYICVCLCVYIYIIN